MTNKKMFREKSSDLVLLIIPNNNQSKMSKTSSWYFPFLAQNLPEVVMGIWSGWFYVYFTACYSKVKKGVGSFQMLPSVQSLPTTENRRLQKAFFY